MRLRQIEVFRAVMLTGTVSEAARLLHVSQPVVTRVLQHAEASLGFRLFERVRGRLQATPEANALYGDVERQVQVLTHHTGEIVGALLANQIDLGFAFAPPGHEAISSEPVASGRMLLAVPRGQPLP
ncbi:LysR family transcriptional regulator, partial [Cupriavidus necator]|uniref:LysR family transcriptional regulator n=1 Tax=Cupriavidus necator TaxID=106590 RepID=UPI0030F3F265